MNILHPTRTVSALVPRYVERFRCVGAQCGDSCCSGWTVSLDKKTYYTYRQLQHPELSGVMESSIARRRSGTTESAYGRIKLKAGSRACPLTVEGLCSVQKNMNESYLSHTCFSYPRYTRKFGTQYEQALSLSCPEAARLALLAPDAFDFIENPATVRTETVANIVAKRGLAVELMDEIRILCMKLVRTEGLELWQKLAVLGIFCENLDEMQRKGMHGMIPTLLQNTVTMIEQGDFIAVLEQMPPNHTAQTMVFASFWKGPGFEVNTGVSISPVQAETVAAIRRGFGTREDGSEVSQEDIIPAYVAGMRRLPEALQATPHLLDHFLLNEMFRELFPFKGNSPYEAYLQLIAEYGLLRFMLAAQCNTDGPLPDAAALVRMVHVFYRLFQHDHRFGQMHRALTKSGFGSLEKVYGFLRA